MKACSLDTLIENVFKINNQLFRFKEEEEQQQHQQKLLKTMFVVRLDEVTSQLILNVTLFFHHVKIGLFASQKKIKCQLNSLTSFESLECFLLLLEINTDFSYRLFQPELF